MAKPQLQDLFDWLSLNEGNRFEIYDVDKNRVINKCASYAELTAGGIPLEDYFTQLLEDKGVQTVQIVKKRKNGSTFIREGCGLNYSLATDAENSVAVSGSLSNGRATPQHSNMGLMGAPGLGFSEIMNLRSDADRFQEAKSELTTLKEKAERLEAENRRLETEVLTYKLGADSKPSALDKLVEGLASNPATLATLIQSFKSPTPAGLNAPAPAPEATKLSDTKSTMIDTITNPHIEDDHVVAAYQVLVQAVQGNEAFLQKYHQLLTDFNLIENASNSNSDSI